MADIPEKSDEHAVTNELRKLLESLLVSVQDAPVDQRQRLLRSLRKWQKGERRKHSRKACSIPVTVAAWRIFEEFIRNISVGGVFSKASAPLPHGEQVTLIFSLPNHNIPIRVTGNVVWTSSEGLGVEFTQPLSDEVKRRIESL